MRQARFEQLGLPMGVVDDGLMCMHWDDFRSDHHSPVMVF